LTTVRNLGENLRRAAQRDPGRRFQQLYDKLYRPDVVEAATEMVVLRQRPLADRDPALVAAEVRRLCRGVFRPGKGGFIDRVVAEAAALVLEPVLLPCRRLAAWGLLTRLEDTLGGPGHTVFSLKTRPEWRVAPEVLPRFLEQRLADRRLLKLLRDFLAAGLECAILAYTPLHVPRLAPGLGPLLAEYQSAWAEKGLAAALGPHGVVLRGGDEWVLVAGKGAAADGWQDILAGFGLVVENLRDAADFEFLGFQWDPASRGGAPRLRPATVAVQAVRRRVGELTRGGTHLGLAQVVARLNRALGEWGSYYRFSADRNPHEESRPLRAREAGALQRQKTRPLRPRSRKQGRFAGRPAEHGSACWPGYRGGADCIFPLQKPPCCSRERISTEELPLSICRPAAVPQGVVFLFP